MRFIGKNRQERNKSFDEKNKMKLALESFAGFPLSLRYDHTFHLIPNVCKCISVVEICTMHLKMRYFTCSVDLNFY